MYQAEEGPDVIGSSRRSELYGRLSPTIWCTRFLFSYIYYTFHRPYFTPMVDLLMCLTHACIYISAYRWCSTLLYSCQFTLLLFLIGNSTLDMFMKANLGIMYTNYFIAYPLVAHFIFESNKKMGLYTKMLLLSTLTICHLELNEVNGRVPTITTNSHAGDHISPRKGFQNISNTWPNQISFLTSWNFLFSPMKFLFIICLKVLGQIPKMKTSEDSYKLTCCSIQLYAYGSTPSFQKWVTVIFLSISTKASIRLNRKINK